MVICPSKNQYVNDEEGKKKLAFTTTAIAHNAQGYYVYFIMKHMINNGSTPDNVIRRGGKFYTCPEPKAILDLLIKFLDDALI